MVPEVGKWDPEEFYVEGSKDANIDVFLFFFSLIPFSFVREAELCVFYDELLCILYRAYMSTGYWVSDNCLDIFESIEGLKPETAKLFFFFRVFFNRFLQEMLLNIYTALESQAGSQLWTVPTEGFLSNFSDYVGGCDAWLVVKKYIGFLFFLQKKWDHLGTWWVLYFLGYIALFSFMRMEHGGWSGRIDHIVVDLGRQHSPKKPGKTSIHLHRVPPELWCHC